MDPADSLKVPRDLSYSGTSQEPSRLSPTGLSPTTVRHSSTLRLDDPVPTNAGPTTPPHQKTRRFRLLPVRSPLLRESRFLSTPPGTKMFQFPGFPPTPYTFRHERQSSKLPGYPIRTPPDQSLLPAHRGLSQVATSFIGSTAKAFTVRPS